MNTKASQHQPTRREVLLAGASLVAAPVALSGVCLPRPVTDNGRSLVLVRLRGGYDGLSVVVPHTNDVYYRGRPTLSVPKKEILPIDDERGMAPELEQLHAILLAGGASIIQGVGYPNAPLSHFKADAIIDSALPDNRVEDEGWIGRLRKHLWPDNVLPELVTHVGPLPPQSLRSPDRPSLCFDTPLSLRSLVRTGPGDSRLGGRSAVRLQSGEGMREHDMLSRLRNTGQATERLAPEIRRLVRRRKPQAEYPVGQFGESMGTIAALLDSGFGARVYHVTHGSFDSHSAGCACQADVQREFSRGIGSFLEDLKGTHAAQNCLVVCYSEFGRRVSENASGGTDHGAASPIWMFGQKLLPGIHGASPSLTDLDENGNLKYSVDYRAVFAAVIDSWLGGDHRQVLRARYDYPEWIKSL